MTMSRREIEVKLAFDSLQDARDAIERAGATPSGPRAFEDNVLFDLADGSLARTGRMLRLRRVGGGALLTFKGPVAGEHRYKVREEAEVTVADAEETVRVLEGAGFRSCYRYQKYRTPFELHGVHLALDETPLGTFVELEGAPEAIDRAAVALGRGAADYLRESYRELQERAAAARGVTAGDLLYPESAS